jgi:hypothetical protein
MMNCGALSLVSKKQTKTAPSSTCSETTGLFNTSTDVLGVRNLMTELGMHQEYPLLLNGAITFAGLWLVSRPAR